MLHDSTVLSCFLFPVFLFFLFRDIVEDFGPIFFFSIMSCCFVTLPTLSLSPLFPSHIYTYTYIHTYIYRALQYHNRARNFFKITQIAWDSLQARPVNAAPSPPAEVPAATASEATITGGINTNNGTSMGIPAGPAPPPSAAASAPLAVAMESAPRGGKSSKRRPLPAASGTASAAGAGDAAGTTGTSMAGAAGATAVAASGVKSHPYQTKPGRHAEAVHEQQLLSRPKTVRTSATGVRKDLLTGSTKVCVECDGVRLTLQREVSLC